MRRLLNELWVTSGPELTHRYDASAYLIKGPEPTLIDCGSSEGYAALKTALHEFGYEPSDIVRVIATHGHWDHLSGMALLRKESNAELYLHEADRFAVETGDFDLTASFLYDHSFPPVEVDHLLCDGDELSINGLTLRVIHTPGHTPGSVCLLTEIDGTRLLIAGDTLWGGYHPKIRSDIDSWQRSIDRLLQEDFDAATIGHMPPNLILNAKSKVANARTWFGALFNPWFTWEPV
jgi:glyoxylase-like metal-dependent hydrolase (beta-lactamase superfamily II)